MDKFVTRIVNNHLEQRNYSVYKKPQGGAIVKFNVHKNDIGETFWRNSDTTFTAKLRGQHKLTVHKLIDRFIFLIHI